MSSQIYLDYNATTPMDAEILEAMLPYLRSDFGNPSSKGHALGWRAEEAVNVAREKVATLFGSDPSDVIFTSGATESLNMAIKGVAMKHGFERTHIVTCATEHKAVLDTCRAIRRYGSSVTVLPVDRFGNIELAQLEDSITDETRLVCLMWGNNETGLIHTVNTFASICSQRGVPFLTDATQACGKIDTTSCQADLIACSGHKLYGPKGVGALINPNTKLTPLIDGGGQEAGTRGGTLNVPGIVGLGAAADRAGKHAAEQLQRVSKLRDELEATITDAVDNITIVGRESERLPNTSGIIFHGVPSAKLLPSIRTLAVSTGSACQSGTGKGSHVIQAMGYGRADSESFVRISLGIPTTHEEIKLACAEIVGAIDKLKPTQPTT